MILVDTSVWVDHLRQGDAGLAAALQAGAVGMHPFVVGELACGNLRARVEVLACCNRCRLFPGPPSAKCCTSSTPMA
jgi:predicted nucleic acid-binding protein